MTRLDLDEELTIVTAAQVRERIVLFLGVGTDVEIDLSAVTDIDTAGLQLLLLARREAERQGMNVTLADPSPTVREVFEFTRLTAEL